MPTPPAAPDPDRTARLQHHVLVVGSVLAVIVALMVLRPRVPLVADRGGRRLLSLGGYGLAGVLLVIGWLLRRRIPAPTPEADRAAWWRTNRGPAVAVWVVGTEGLILGAIFWLLTGNLFVLLALSGVGLVHLFTSSPDRLLGD